jgi:hypothetical protein
MSDTSVSIFVTLGYWDAYRATVVLTTRMFRVFLLLLAVGILFRWLWTRSSITKATIESGRTIFPPVREIRILFAFIAIAIATLLIWCSLTLQPSEWWLPYVCLVLLVGVPLMIPPVLTIDVDCIVSRTWFGYEKQIRWEDIASLDYNVGNKYFTVRDRKVSNG